MLRSVQAVLTPAWARDLRMLRFAAADFVEATSLPV